MSERERDALQLHSLCSFAQDIRLVRLSRVIDHERARASRMVPRRGLEPPRPKALVPKTSASTSSATSARGTGAFYPRAYVHAN